MKIDSILTLSKESAEHSTMLHHMPTACGINNIKKRVQSTVEKTNATIPHTQTSEDKHSLSLRALLNLIFWMHKKECGALNYASPHAHGLWNQRQKHSTILHHMPTACGIKHHTQPY